MDSHSVIESKPMMHASQKPRLHELGDKNNQYGLNMEIFRKYEGLAAPLTFGMELFAARKIGRLPFLQSSKMMEDVLLARDEIIDFEDIFGGPENLENLVQPHCVMEKTFATS